MATSAPSLKHAGVPRRTTSGIRDTVELQQRPAAVFAPVRDRCTLTVAQGSSRGAVLAVGREGAVIGRGQDSGCPLDDPAVSGNHAALRFDGKRFVIEDLQSTNGTYVNGRRLLAPQALADGDRVQMGHATSLLVAIHDASEQQVATQLYHAAIRDPLTKLYNRGFFEDRLRSEFAFAARHGEPLALLFLDLDHFTAVNNTWGHQAGDAVLQQTAMTMASTIRTEDVLARYGGEEFVLLARATALEPGILLAQRLRGAVAELAIPHNRGIIRITASIGLACFDPQRSSFSEPAALVFSADQAVYRAKREGRNRVCTL
jgi:diguanylate cyclase (GGDEF)-like protein